MNSPTNQNGINHNGFDHHTHIKSYPFRQVDQIPSAAWGGGRVRPRSPTQVPEDRKVPLIDPAILFVFPGKPLEKQNLATRADRPVFCPNIVLGVLSWYPSHPAEGKSEHIGVSLISHTQMGVAQNRRGYAGFGPPTRVPFWYRFFQPQPNHVWKSKQNVSRLQGTFWGLARRKEGPCLRKASSLVFQRSRAHSSPKPGVATLLETTKVL